MAATSKVTYAVRYTEAHWRWCLDQAAKHAKYRPVRVLATGRTQEDAAEAVRPVARVEMVPEAG